MTIGGWVMMITIVGGMTGLMVWCVCRVIRAPGAAQKLHSQADIDPRDREA